MTEGTAGASGPRDADKIGSHLYFQRLGEAGYDGGITIVKDYVHRIRPRHQPAFVKLDFEPGVHRSSP